MILRAELVLWVFQLFVFDTGSSMFTVLANLLGTIGRGQLQGYIALLVRVALLVELSEF